MLVIFSTSDYLINKVLAFIVKAFQSVVGFLSDVKASASQSSLRQDSCQTQEITEQIEQVTFNCSHLCNTCESIVKIRLLDNFTPINPQIKRMLNMTLNEIFINLTDSYPLIAIQFSKIVQLVAL
jgi:hypothetical protein